MTKPPRGHINSTQLRELLWLDDPVYGRVDGTQPGHCIKQLTDDIAEIHVTLSKMEGIRNHHAVLWINQKGQTVATAHGTREGGAIAYRHHPDDLWKFGGRVDTINHEDMWGLGNTGAVYETRQWILDNFTATITTTKEQ